MSFPSVSILIVNYQTARCVVELVESIRSHLKRIKFEILILDNSVDERERAELNCVADDDVHITVSETNLGFVTANNDLLRQVHSEMLVLLNPDTKILDGSLEDMIEYVFTHQNVGVAGPMLLNEDGSYQVSYYKFPTLLTLCMEHLLLWPANPYTYRSNNGQMQKCEVVKGTCLVMRTAVAHELSLFDPDLVMYSEEVDLCARLTKRGYAVVYFPGSRILHYGEQSTKKEAVSEYSLFHYYRSKRILFRKHRSRFSAGIASSVLCVSLLERALVLGMFNRLTAARNHFRVFNRLYLLREG